jgi:hypothetical protein
MHRHEQKRGCASSCGSPFSQAPTRPSHVKKRRDPHVRTNFHKPTSFAPNSNVQPTHNTVFMSSFHTVDHSAYWSCGPDQLVEDAGHDQEQAAATFYRGANAPVTVSLELFPG